MYSTSGDYSEMTTTDRNGRFSLHDGDAPDSTRFVLQSIPTGRQSAKLELIIDAPSYPPRIIPVLAPEAADQNLFTEYINKAEQHSIYQHGRRLVQLDEFTVTGKKRPERTSTYYILPDATVTEAQIDKFPPANLSSLLIRLPYVVVDADGTITVMRGGERCSPLFLVDDFPVSTPNDFINISDMEWVDVSDIAQIDLVRSSTTMYARGKSCVIAIYTKIGNKKESTKNFNIKAIVPLGFQTPVEFYAPKYDSPDHSPEPDLRTTIHWQPALVTNEAGEASFSFYTADSRSTYTLIIEGVTDDGKMVYKREKVMVGDKKGL